MFCEQGTCYLPSWLEKWKRCTSQTLWGGSRSQSSWAGCTTKSNLESEPWTVTLGMPRASHRGRGRGHPGPKGLAAPGPGPGWAQPTCDADAWGKEVALPAPPISLWGS